MLVVGFFILNIIGGRENSNILKIKVSSKYILSFKVVEMPTVTILFLPIQGPVMYDESGDRQGLTQIEQLHHNVEVRVGVFDPTLKSTNKIRWEANKTIVWIGEG